MDHAAVYIGMHVLYVPAYAKGVLSHPDVERGVVTDIRPTLIFVRFGGDTHSKACRAEQLR